MTISKEGCKGCKTALGTECLFDIKNVHLCPCQTCLVKCMCGGSCAIYRDFITEDKEGISYDHS